LKGWVDVAVFLTHAQGHIQASARAVSSACAGNRTSIKESSTQKQIYKEKPMAYLLWIGVGLTLLGVAALAYCIKMVIGLRRQNLNDQDLRAGMQRAVALNMAALAVSGLGLMVVVMALVMS
jgi:hypothetical protein